MSRRAGLVCCWLAALLGGAGALPLGCSSSPGGAAPAGPQSLSSGPARQAGAGAAPPADAAAAAAAPAPGCTLAEPLAALELSERSVLTVTGTTALASDTNQSTFGSCAGASAGPDVWYQLDLSRARGPVVAQAVVDARFDAVLDLRRGPCGDSRSVTCDRAHAVGGSSSALTAQLEPGVYWLVVGGASETSAGDFRLQIELNPRPGCLRRPENGSCTSAVQLEPLERQTVLLDEACNVDADGDTALYYELDLSAEPAPVLASVSIWTLAARRYEHVRVFPVTADGPDCEVALASGYLGDGSPRSSAALQTLLQPGKYIVEADPRSILPGVQLALGVQLDRQACPAGPVANDCAQAIDLDASAAAQVLAGNTVCNTNQRSVLPCTLEGDDAPEQYYRLDLRGAAGVTRTRLTVLVDGLGFEPVLYVLTGNASGECGDILYCDDRVLQAEGPPAVSLLLEPALYFVGVDGANRGAAGAYQLLVELAPEEPSPCVNTRIYDCMIEGPQTLECCREWSPLCTQMVAACGLSSATQECVCTTQPACCASTLLPTDCSATLQACGYLCPDFAPSDLYCWADRP